MLLPTCLRLVPPCLPLEWDTPSAQHAPPLSFGSRTDEGARLRLAAVDDGSHDGSLTGLLCVRSARRVDAVPLSCFAGSCLADQFGGVGLGK